MKTATTRQFFPSYSTSVGSWVLSYIQTDGQREFNNCEGSRDSSVGIVTGYGLDDQDSITGRDIRFVSLLHSDQTAPGVHPASHVMDTGGCSPGGKAIGA
jgi:hypothetical protein